MMIKYRVEPGGVRSANDGDLHWISARKLMALYRVDPRECMIITKANWHVRGVAGLIPLRPREDGNYARPRPPEGRREFLEEAAGETPVRKATAG